METGVKLDEYFVHGCVLSPIYATKAQTNVYQRKNVSIKP